MKNSKLPQYIFLIIWDCVRKDHIGAYGYSRGTSPHLDILSKQADVYNWAIAPSNYTLASVPAMLAGKYPSEISNSFTGTKFSAKDFSLLKKMKKLGYKTAFFTANFVTSSKYTNIYKYFDYFSDDLTEKEINREEILYQKANRVFKSAEKYVLKNKKNKIFIVLHLMEAHGPYLPDIKSKFTDDQYFKKDKRQITRVTEWLGGLYKKHLEDNFYVPRYQLLDVVKSPNGDIEDYERSVNKYVAQYDMGIFLLDLYTNNFFKFLKKQNIFDKSELIITSDHGELLGEENIFFTHGHICHPNLVNVPLIVKKPFQTKRQLINKNFSTINLIRHYTGQEEVQEICSFHPKSVFIMKENQAFLFHNGDFTSSETLKENIFHTANHSIRNGLLNFKDYTSSPYVKRYKKVGNQFIEVNSELKIDVISVYIKSLKPFFNLIVKDYRSLVQKVQKLEKKITDQAQFIDTIQKLEKKITDQAQFIDTIQKSKAYRLWRFYNRIKDKYFKYAKN